MEINYLKVQKENRQKINQFKIEILNTADGQEMVAQKIDEVRELLGKYNNRLSDLETFRINNLSSNIDWWTEFLIMDEEDNIKYLEKRLWRTKNMESMVGMYEIGGGDSFDLERIKEIPIGEIIGKPAIYDSSTRAKYSCPLHEENHGSFIWYKDNNTWHCFGACATGGDNIALYQKMNDCNFIQACRALKRCV